MTGTRSGGIGARGRVATRSGGRVTRGRVATESGRRVTRGMVAAGSEGRVTRGRVAAGSGGRRTRGRVAVGSGGRGTRRMAGGSQKAWVDLPEELQQGVLGFLDTPQLLRCRLVSQKVAKSAEAVLPKRSFMWQPEISRSEAFGRRTEVNFREYLGAFPGTLIPSLERLDEVIRELDKERNPIPFGMVKILPPRNLSLEDQARFADGIETLAELAGERITGLAIELFPRSSSDVALNIVETVIEKMPGHRRLAVSRSSWSSHEEMKSLTKDPPYIAASYLTEFFVCGKKANHAFGLFRPVLGRVEMVAFYDQYATLQVRQLSSISSLRRLSIQCFINVTIAILGSLPPNQLHQLSLDMTGEKMTGNFSLVISPDSTYLDLWTGKLHHLRSSKLYFLGRK